MTPKLASLVLSSIVAGCAGSNAFAQSQDLKDIDVKAIKGDVQLASKAGQDASTCQLQEADFNYQLARKTEGAFTVFLTKKDGNAFQLCVNARQTIFGSGIIVPGSLKEEGEDLVFETVHPKVSVPHADAAAGKPRGSDWVAPVRTYELVQRYKHRIALKKLSYDALQEASSAGSVPSVEKLAWATILVDMKTGKNTAMAVRLKDDEPSAAEQLVRKGLALPKLGGTVSDGASADQIAGFVRSEVGKHRDKGLPLLSTPLVWLELSPKKDADEPAVVASILARGRKAGADEKGQDIVDAMDYDELLFCRQKARLEKRSSHNAHLSAAAKSAAAK